MKSFGRGASSNPEPNNNIDHNQQSLDSAIQLDKKKPSHRFVVAPAQEFNDRLNAVVNMNPNTMKALDWSYGNTVLVKGNKGRDIVCIVMPDETCEASMIGMNKVVRSNLRVRFGDIVYVHPCPDVKHGKRVHILPVDDTIEGFSGNLFDTFLKGYFLKAYLPVTIGDMFVVHRETRSVEFKVVKTDPDPYCIVAPNTVIDWEGEPIKRKDEEKALNEVDFDGGLLKHSVFFRFKSNTTEHVQREVMKRFLALKDLCVNPNTGEPYILSLVAGVANSPEGADQKMTQGYIVTFSNASDRNYYVGQPFYTPYDPHHDAFKKFVGPLLDADGAFVFDFTVSTMPGGL